MRTGSRDKRKFLCIVHFCAISFEIKTKKHKDVKNKLHDSHKHKKIKNPPGLP